MATLKPAVDPRIEAAEYLATSVTGVKAEMLVAAADVRAESFIESTFAKAIRMHTTCGCEHALRLERAHDILLGIAPARPGELRLL